MHFDLNTVLGTMAITAILGALPKKASDWHWTSVYDVPYSAVMAFWSMKTGQKPPDPTLPVTNPAQTK